MKEIINKNLAMIYLFVCGLTEWSHFDAPTEIIERKIDTLINYKIMCKLLSENS
jgi:hypothetical protein